MKAVEKRVADNPPGINIADITRAFYSNHKIPGQQALSNAFRLDYIKNELKDDKYPKLDLDYNYQSPPKKNAARSLNMSPAKMMVSTGKKKLPSILG